MHSTDNIKDGYMGSGKRLWHSFNYHGKDNHTVEILEYYDTRKELREREVELVNEDLLKKDLCMNLAPGGGGGFSSEEHRKKFMMSSKVGTKNFIKRLREDDEFRRLHNERTVKNMNNYRKGLKTGVYTHHGFHGKTHSEETKNKLSELAKKRVGDKNSQYGTCWITKDGENKKIKKEDLDSYLVEGWVRGRKYD